MLRMKALKSFFGAEGNVRRGREFDVADRFRADDLERRGLAVPVAASPAPTEPPIVNEAAVAGPLSAPPGGETGGAAPSPSSRPARAPRKLPKRSGRGGRKAKATS